ncbi:unnamed protein product [Caenorhabditis auriculariae]|uniref:Uncharacterized protein n=1 Tax=Caenorhabditis auriculariae TaxID=2777116 RepID=A0A8S1H1X2_9PELO|nr:unnamed protein product [Caenorhabditis auriculariae]
MHTSTNERLAIRVERGTKPQIIVDQRENHVLVYIPVDTTVNYQPVTSHVGFGYNVKLQRMQQQYKITLQHQVQYSQPVTHEKKPECVVYASSVSHDQEIKTTVKEVNSRVPQMTIAGSNLEVNGVLRGQNLTFESTVGTMHVYAKITCTSSLRLHSQNVVLSTEALLSTNDFKVVCRKLQIDGRVFPNEPDLAESSTASDLEESRMRVDLSCSLVHIGIDGCIGASNERDKAKKGQKQVTASHLNVSIAGGLANYGKIVAKEHIDLMCSGSLLSLSDGSLDSAGRGYNALKQLRKVDATTPGAAPSSSFMHSAIQNQNAGAVANLIENGVDLNDTISSRARDKRMTLRQSAMQEYREARKKSSLNSARARITLINALFSAHDWRRGSIAAASIRATIARNCDDCAQFNAKQLQLKIGGSATVEKDSIWSSTWVEMDVAGSVTANGQVKLRTLILTAKGSVVTTSEAILSFEVFGRVSCTSFDCDGMWCAGESLVLETTNNSSFTSGSYVESDKLELECTGACSVDGTWQLASCWAHVQGMMTVQANGKLFVEDAADLSALGLHFHGFAHVVEQFTLIVQDSAHFFHSSRVECQTLKLTCKAFCTIGGLVAVHDLQAYVRHDIITTSTGKMMVTNNADVTSGAFKNDSLWQVEKAMKLIAGVIEQSEDGVLFVKCSLTAHVHDVCVESFGGRLVSSDVFLKCLKECEFDGLIRCNELQIALPYSAESRLRLQGQVDVVVGSLTVIGNLNSEGVQLREAVPPGLTIACNLTAAAIIAPFSSIHVDATALVRLSGVKSKIESDPNILINAGALSTAKESCIVSLAAPEDVKKEAVICATVFQHQGQVKFVASDVRLVAGTIIHHGRLTNMENKQNHVKHLNMVIGELLLNHGIIACDVLNIRGEGVLENTNRIYAVESMDIRLSNFDNEEGLIESKNTMKLLAVSKEWTKLGGSIKAKKSFDLCANRLNMAIRNVQNLSIDKRLSFSAKTDLLISSDVIDEAKELSVGCAAQQCVAIDANMQLDRLEVLLGGDSPSSDPVAFVVHADATIIANTVLISAKSEHLQISFDGAVQCSRLRFAGGIRKVTITGAGHLECTYLAAQHVSVGFEMYSTTRLDEVHSQKFAVVNDSIFRLEPCADSEDTTIVTEDVAIDGTMLLEKKLLIKSKGGCMRINGPVLGSSPASELTCEASKVVLKGQIANFKFVELFARETITIQNQKLLNIERLSIDCADLSMYSVDVEKCLHTVVSCDAFTATGKIVGCEVLNIFSTNIHSKMDISDVEKMVVNCKRSTAIRGKLQKVKVLEVDSKWINLSADVSNCEELKLTAWAVSSNDQLRAERIQITALTAFVNNSSLLATTCNIVAPFVLSLSALSTISSSLTSVHALCMCTRNDMVLTGTAFLWLAFDPVTGQVGVNSAEMNAWKTTSAMMRDRWSTASIDADEVLIGLKYISDLQPVKIRLNTDNKIYESLVELCSRFDSTPVSLINFGELVGVICSARVLFALLPEANNNQKKGRKKSDCALYEGLVPFKAGKYSKESNNADSSDTDIGYVSRSSSEDLNSSTKSTRPRSPLCDDPTTSFFTETHLKDVEVKVNEAAVEVIEEPKFDQVAYAMKEEEELAEFEELEEELAMAEAGTIRTDYIVCRDRNIYLAKLKEKIQTLRTPRPKSNLLAQRAPSSNDLVMKKLQVKNAISSLDLRSFGSQSSLTSLDFGAIPDFGSPLTFQQSSPFQRSKIPLGSFRSPKKVPSRAATPTTRWNY